MELDVYIKKTKVFELFESLTLGGKIIALSCLDRDFIGEIFTSKRTRFTKKEIMQALESAKKIRNHFAHNYFILNKGPYLKMTRSNEQVSDHEKIKYLFSNVDTILKISSRNDSLQKVKNSILKEINSDPKLFRGVSLRHFDSLLLK